MINKIYLTTMIVLTIITTSCSEEKKNNDFVDDKFKVGQIWKYKTRVGEESSLFTVLKVEKYDSVGIIIHIYIDGLKVKNIKRPSGFSEYIGHTPISKDALLKSVTSLVSENNKLPEFKEGYDIWADAFNKNEGGIFSINLQETIGYIEETFIEGQKTSN